MKILGKVLVGLAGLVGGALIERGITGYGDDIAELRKKSDPDEIEDVTDEGDEETEAENDEADESAENTESEDSDG